MVNGHQGSKIRRTLTAHPVPDGGSYPIELAPQLESVGMGRAEWQFRRRSRTPIWLTAIAILIPAISSANVGRIPATFAVSQNGGARYTVPIWTPPGPNGLEPHIALEYDSHAGSGYLGEDWSITGLSAITRCDKTVAQDGTPQAITLQTDDGYCLDGNRLRLVSGTYGTSGSVYETEIANFEQVTMEGTSGNGPAYFEVKDRNGVTYEYGNGGNSLVTPNGATTPWQWWLDKVTDPAGNTMTISYNTGTNAGAAAVPNTISWTPDSYGSTSYEYQIVFTYGSTNTASSSYGYVDGYQVHNGSLLSSINVEYSNSTIRDYFLNYGVSSTTGLQELTGVQECADSAKSNCLPSTTFSYQTVTAGDSAGSDSIVSATAVEVSAVHTDFTGNGQDDIAYCNGGSPNTIDVVFGSASGYGTPVKTGIGCGALYGDLTASGKDGILSPNGGDWYYYTWNGSSFTGQNTGLAYDSTATQFALADVNGDGRPDLLTSYLTSTVISKKPLLYQYTYTIEERQNVSSGSTASFATSQSAWYTFSNLSGIQANMITDSSSGYGAGTTTHLDFNGDGRQDIALEMAVRSCVNCVNTNMTYYELLSGNSSFTAQAIATVDNSSFLQVYFLNFNSDRCTDYAVYSTLYISGCNGAAAQSIAIPGGADMIGAMDWNGDGHTDILVQNGSTIGVYLSEGNALNTSLITTSIPYNASDGYFTFDPSGSGMQSIGAVTNGGIIYYPNNSQDEPPDLLTKIIDGYGNWIAPSYVSLADAGSTYQADGAALSGYQDYIGPYYVVKQVQYSDPSNPPNATFTKTYSYYGAEVSTTGRGFAGFGAQYMLDSRNSLYTSANYDHTFPYTGMLLSKIETEGSAGGQRVAYESLTISTPQEDTLSSTTYEQRYFPYNPAATKESYAVGGTENGSLIATESDSYSYDTTSGDLTSFTKTIKDNDPGSPYDGYAWTTSVSNTPSPNQSTWCLSMLTASTISYSDTYDNSSISVSRGLTPDTTYCRYNQIVTGASPYQVTENFVYDSFGNVQSHSVIGDTTSGANMTARTTTTNWGTTGQFPNTITDPLKETTTIAYNYSCGLPSSEADPDGATTQWTYGDGFCRVTEEQRPDKTYTTFGYTLYSGSDPKARMVVTREDRDASGNVLRTTVEDMDMQDRPYIKQTNLIDGSMATVMQDTYDSLGRISSQQEPYQGNTVGAVSYGYDLLNRVTEAQRPTSASDSTPATTLYQYNGLTTQITDPNGDTSTIAYDPNGWVRRSTDDLGYSVIFGYDATGSRTSVTDSLNNTLWTGTWAHGIGSFLTSSTSMDSGTTTYVVDPLGEVTNWTDAKGQQFSEQYDELSRPLQLFEPDYYTQWNWGTSSTYYNLGHLVSVCTGTGSNPTACNSSGESESWTYDSSERVTSRTINIPNSGAYTYTWQYSPTTGFLSDLTYPASLYGTALTLQYGYSNGYLQSITDTLSSPNVVIWAANAMDPAGQVTKETLGNNIVTTRAFDAVTHLLSAIQSGVSGNPLVQNESYLYDADENLTERQNNNLGLTENFYYDGDNRLSYSTLNGTRNLTMAYDPMGDITSRSDVSGGAAWTYDPVRKHEVTQAGSSAYHYAYDANGDMTSWDGNAVTWTSYNYPSSISDAASGESVSFQYGPNHNPWLETTQEPSGTTTTYHLGRLMSIVNSSNGLLYRNYIFAGNMPVAVDTITNSGESLDYFQLGAQQSISAISNSSGQSLVSESYSAYGGRRNSSTWSGPAGSADLSTSTGITQHGYTFQEALGLQMNLNDMVGRVQDATTGRFLSADPFVSEPANTQDWNPYSYTYNNPMSYEDPSGFLTCQATSYGIQFNYSTGGSSTDWLYTSDTCEEDSPNGGFSQGRGAVDGAGGASTSSANTPLSGMTIMNVTVNGALIPTFNIQMVVFDLQAQLQATVGSIEANLRQEFAPKTKSCTFTAKFSAVGPNQATNSKGALGISPSANNVAISPGIFGLPYNTIPERISTQQLLEANMASIQIQASGLSEFMTGTTTFTIGDVGDENIRNSTIPRFDIYGWATLQDALQFGVRTTNVTMTGVPSSWSCPGAK